MKIIFLCGALEPGKDGVGDYTRRLAIEMIKQGHQVSAIALKDWHVTDIVTDVQDADNGILSVLRLPATLPVNKRFELAKKWVDDFDPHWLSLQFVNFAFHFKGFHIGLGKKLAALGKGRRWHIMFHELWVGMASNSSKKHIVWGKAQKILIKQLVKKLKPTVINTQCQLYVKQLSRLGYKVGYLPLFSNIPVLYPPQNGNNLIRENQLAERKNISFILFGSIHPLAPVRPMVGEMKNYALKNNVTLHVSFVGKSGGGLDYWLSELDLAKIPVTVHGQQDAAKISQILSEAAIGISTSSLAYIEKSGTVVAMLEHGLPVICVAESIHFADVEQTKVPYGVSEYKIGNLEECINKHFEFRAIENVSDVSKKIIDSFSMFK